MHDTYAARTTFEPQVQRYRDYARQRQMTLSDLLLENRVVFLGASPEVQFPQINDLSASLRGNTIVEHSPRIGQFG